MGRRRWVNLDDAGWDYDRGKWLYERPVTVEHVVFDFLEGRVSNTQYSSSF